MSPETCFERELNKKGVAPEDVVKLCYQAAFGAEHLIVDSEGVRKYFFDEFSNTAESDCPLYEQISENFVRVNLGAWKKRGLSPEYLVRLFVMKSSAPHKGEEDFYRYISLSKKILSKEQNEALDNYFEDYIKGGLRAVSHSARYKKENSPSYRLIDVYKARLIPILEKITENKNEKCILAIDGRAASGKTTAADILSFVTGADVIRMDDFFLPISLRSPERYEEAGGNIHYERFKDEIVDKIPKANEISYGKFDCSVMDITGNIIVKTNRLLIIEGVYSHHPYFGNYADIKVFFDIDSNAQIKRIIKRNGSEMAKRFENVWIPLEEKYYSEFGIKESADIVL